MSNPRSPVARRAIAPSAAAFLILLVPGTLFAQRTESVFSGPVPDGMAVRVASATGEVDVRPAAGSTLEVTGVARGDDGDIAFEVLRTGDEIVVCALRVDIDRCTDRGVESRNGRWSDDDTRGDLRVLLPAGVDVTAASGNGRVRVEGAGGDVFAASGNGSVDVDGAAGEVHAASGNGAVTVARAGGPVEASSGNGRVVVSTARGPVTASSGNGDLEIDIASLPSGGEAMRFSSGNGTIELTLPADFHADLEAHLGNGEVESDFPLTLQGRLNPHHVEARIGNGGRRLTVSSGNGDLILHRR